MKPFNDTHKKWLLTASLASLLSFNLVMTLVGPTPKGHTADFASEAPGGTVNTEKGSLKVKFYSAAGGNKTRAVYESGNCESGSCEEDEVLLPIKFNIDDLNKMLVAAQKDRLGVATSATIRDPKESDSSEKDDKEAPKKETAEERRERLAEEREREREEREIAKEEKEAKKERDQELLEEKGSERLKKLADKCTKLNIEEVRLACYSKGLSDILRGRSIDRLGKPSDADMATNWETNLRSDMTNALLNKNGPKAREDALKLLGLASRSKEYPTLKRAVLLTATQTVVGEHIKLQKLAEKYKLPNGKYDPRFKAAYDQQLGHIGGLKEELGSILSPNMMTEAEAAFFQTAYESPTAKIEEAMKKFTPYQPLKPIGAGNYASYDVEAVEPTTPQSKSTTPSKDALDRTNARAASVEGRKNGLTANSPTNAAQMQQNAQGRANEGSIVQVNPGAAGNMPQSYNPQMQQQVRPGTSTFRPPAPPSANGARMMVPGSRN